TFLSSGSDVAAVRGQAAAHAQQAGLLVEDVQNLIDRLVLFVADVLYNRRVDVAGAGTHDEALQRGQAHRGVDALAADRGGNGSAVADVADDDFRVLRIQAAEFDCLFGDKAVAGAVEAVAADAVLLIVLVRDGVQVGLLVHAHAEGGVEYSYVRFARANFFTGLDTHQVGRRVQRAQVEALADR